MKVSISLYFLTTSKFHGVENYFPRLSGTGISVAIFTSLESLGVHCFTRLWGMGISDAILFVF